MKKQVKKLMLAKETLRSLTPMESRWVAGGSSPFPTEETYTCGCFTGTCGTGYCNTGAPTVGCWSDPNYTCLPDFNPGGTSAC